MHERKETKGPTRPLRTPEQQKLYTDWLSQISKAFCILDHKLCNFVWLHQWPNWQHHSTKTPTQAHDIHKFNMNDQHGHIIAHETLPQWSRVYTIFMDPSLHISKTFCTIWPVWPSPNTRTTLAHGSWNLQFLSHLYSKFSLSDPSLRSRA